MSDVSVPHISNKAEKRSKKYFAKKEKKLMKRELRIGKVDPVVKTIKIPSGMPKKGRARVFRDQCKRPFSDAYNDKVIVLPTENNHYSVTYIPKDPYGLFPTLVFESLLLDSAVIEDGGYLDTKFVGKGFIVSHTNEELDTLSSLVKEHPHNPFGIPIVLSNGVKIIPGLHRPFPKSIVQLSAR